MTRVLELNISASLPDDERRVQEAITRQFQHEIQRHEIVIRINDSKIKLRDRSKSL